MLRRTVSILASAALMLALPASSLAAVPAVAGSAPKMSMSFAPGIIYAGNNSTLTMTVSNPDAIAMSDVGFQGTLPSGVTSASTSKSACGGTLSVSGKTITFAGGSLAASAGCSMTITVRGASSGSYSVSATPSNGATTGSTATASIRVLITPTATLYWKYQGGSTATYALMIKNPNGLPISGVSFSVAAGDPQVQFFSSMQGSYLDPSVCRTKATTDHVDPRTNAPWSAIHKAQLTTTLPARVTCEFDFDVYPMAATLSLSVIKTPYGSIPLQDESDRPLMVAPTLDATMLVVVQSTPTASASPIPSPTPVPASDSPVVSPSSSPSPAPAAAPATGESGFPTVALGFGGLAVIGIALGAAVLWRRRRALLAR
jgi:hypothetical protein